MYQALHNSVLITTYNNGLYISSLVAFGGVALALTMKGGRPDPGAAVHVEM